MPLKKSRYFTNDHEWIDFKGYFAYAGVCSFKLIGIKQIENIDFVQNIDLFKANDVIGSVYCADYKIDVHMPVTGRIISFNGQLLDGQFNHLLNHPETNGWFALIVPSAPYNRTGVLNSEEYQIKTKRSW